MNITAQPIRFGNKEFLFSNKKDKDENPKKLSREVIMLSAVSASGIGRVIGLDTGKDLALDWARKKASGLTKNKEEQKLMTEALLKKIKFPVTFLSTTVGVLIGLFSVLIPAKLYNDNLSRK